MNFLLCCFACIATVLANDKNKLPSRRVIDGTEAYPGQFPYVARLYYGSLDWCTATIIHERWALTAAHCIDYNKPDPKILVGSIDSASDPNGRFYNAENTLRHEAFTFTQDGQNRVTSLANDIGLIRLNTPIAFSANVQAVRLAAYVGNYDNKIATIVGFGKSNLNGYPNNKLRYGSVQMINDQQCRQQYITFASDSMLCGQVVGTQSVCAGDSGGPLIANGIQMGVTSASYGKCVPGGLPNLFSKVSSFKPWIQRQLSTYGDVLPS